MRLELRGITKRFGSLVANDRIDLVVEPGEIHCLLGENGAGKSTLMNVLYGLYHPDEGEILVDGETKDFHGPRDAIAAGIGMVHQHFMLVPVFTVAENVILGDEPVSAASGGPLVGWLDRRRARKHVREVSERYGLPVDPDARVENLPVGVQQRVEIVKALVREAQVLILDEPTAVLTPQEIEELFAVMNTLREAGKSIVFITHKLKEVKAIADRITVIRRGKVVGEATPEMTEQDLASMMVGRDVRLTVDKAPAEPGGAAFDVRGLTVLDRHGNAAVDDISFTVRAGEILGIAGVDGNGQSELVQAIMGLVPAQAGSITLDGKQMIGLSPRKVLGSGVGFVPEDRSHDGLVGDFSVAENLVLDLYKTEPFAGVFSLDLGEIERNAKLRVEEFDIRPADPGHLAGKLSGGNQQKVVVAREMSRPLRLLVASQPTRGVDVGAQEFIHKRIVAERDQGRPVVIVSTELDEVLSLADTVAVMYRGRIVGTVSPQTSREEIGLLMAGITSDDAAVGAAPPEGSERADRADRAEEIGQAERGSTTRPGADAAAAADGRTAGGQAADVRARGGGMGGVGPVGGAGEATGRKKADGGGTGAGGSGLGAGGVTGAGEAGAGAAGEGAAGGGAANGGPAGGSAADGGAAGDEGSGRGDAASGGAEGGSAADGGAAGEGSGRGDAAGGGAANGGPAGGSAVGGGGEGERAEGGEAAGGDGSQGPQGSEGPREPQGSQEPQEPDGSQGPLGPQRPQGTQESQGPEEGRA